jgi:hypothetical protein
MNKRINFENGEKYPLGDYFSGINEKIIIPDLQRDYCWGSQGYVSGFLDSLMRLDQEKSITLGLVYGYIDQDLIQEHLQLCDGQQRLTTLFLIIGMLARYTDNQDLQNHLMSDFELKNDDREPYLLYAIRESSVYFLSDLTYYFFLKQGNIEIECVEDIKRQSWFLDSYYQDPSIISMLDALHTIENQIAQNPQVNLTQFGAFLLEKVELLFVDMESRENGEETFVIINTTGEPLTKNENLKPNILINNKQIEDVAKRWEKMEQWFWYHRNKNVSPEHTSDEGLSQFVRITRLLEAKNAKEYIKIRKDESFYPFQSIPFDRIEKVFNAYARLYTLDGYERRYDRCPDYTKGYTEADLYVILPVLTFLLRTENPISNEQLLRIYHVFSNLRRYRYTDVDEHNGIAPAFSAIKAVRELNVPLFSYLVTSAYLPDGERDKYEQLLKWTDLVSEQMSDIEAQVAEAESNPIFRGRIEELIRWAQGNRSDFYKLYCRFKSLWPIEYGHELDQLRLKLLTLPLNNYPLNYPNKGILTLCNEPEHWYTLIKHNSQTIFEKLLNLVEANPLEIDYSNLESNKYRGLISHPEWMARMERANIITYTDNLYLLLRKERTSSNYWIIFHDQSFADNVLKQFPGWGLIWKRTTNDTLYCEYSLCDFTIELKEEYDHFRLILSQGLNHKPFTEYDKFDLLANSFKMEKSDELNLVYSKIVAIADAKSLIKDIASKISETFASC